jgi:hypothetical protein
VNDFSATTLSSHVVPPSRAAMPRL